MTIQQLSEKYEMAQYWRKFFDRQVEEAKRALRQAEDDAYKAYRTQTEALEALDNAIDAILDRNS